MRIRERERERVLERDRNKKGGIFIVYFFDKKKNRWVRSARLFCGIITEEY